MKRPLLPAAFALSLLSLGTLACQSPSRQAWYEYRDGDYQGALERWTPLAEAGLAWSTALCAVVQVTALTITLRRRLGLALITPAVRGSWGRALVATAAGQGQVRADRSIPEESVPTVP